MTATRFVPTINPFTREEVIRFVPVPKVHSKRKGETQHDEKFSVLLGFEEALCVPEHEFGGMRKSLRRFLENRGLLATVTMRQRKDPRTKSYTIWLANEPPHHNRKAKE